MGPPTTTPPTSTEPFTPLSSWQNWGIFVCPFIIFSGNKVVAKSNFADAIHVSVYEVAFEYAVGQVLGERAAPALYLLRQIRVWEIRSVQIIGADPTTWPYPPPDLTRPWLTSACFNVITYLASAVAKSCMYVCIICTYTVIPTPRKCRSEMHSTLLRLIFFVIYTTCTVFFKLKRDLLVGCVRTLQLETKRHFI